jgi:hypothetical protein
LQLNLAQLATPLLACDLVSEDAAQAAVDSYGPQVLKLHNSGTACKLGLANCVADLVITFAAHADIVTSTKYRSCSGILLSWQLRFWLATW